MTSRRDPPVSVRIDRETMSKIKAAALLDSKTAGSFIRDAAADAAEGRIRQEAEEAENRRRDAPVNKGRPGMVGRLFGQKPRSGD